MIEAVFIIWGPLHVHMVAPCAASSSSVPQRANVAKSWGYEYIFLLQATSDWLSVGRYFARFQKKLLPLSLVVCSLSLYFCRATRERTAVCVSSLVLWLLCLSTTTTSKCYSICFYSHILPPLCCYSSMVIIIPYSLVVTILIYT